MIEAATEKQVSYLSALLKERDAEHETVKAVNAVVGLGYPIFNKTSASSCIGEILKVEKAAPVSLAPDYKKIAETVAELKPGVYDLHPESSYLSGKYAVVSPANKHGQKTAKAMHKSYSTKSGWSSHKINVKAVAFKVAIGAAAMLAADEVGALGKKLGVCMCCAAILSDSESVAKGIGPVCEKKYGYLF